MPPLVAKLAAADGGFPKVDVVWEWSCICLGQRGKVHAEDGARSSQHQASKNFDF